MADKRPIEGSSGVEIGPGTDYRIVEEGFVVQFNLKESLTHFFDTAGDELKIEIMRLILRHKFNKDAVYRLEKAMTRCIDNRQIEFEVLSGLCGYPMDFIQTRTGEKFGLLAMVLRTAGINPKYKHFPNLYPERISVVFQEILFSNVYAYYIEIYYKPIHPLIFTARLEDLPRNFNPEITKSAILLFDKAGPIGTQYGALVSTALQSSEWLQITGLTKKAFLKKMQSHLGTPEEG